MTKVGGGWRGKLGRYYKNPKVNSFSAYEFWGAGKSKEKVLSKQFWYRSSLR